MEVQQRWQLEELVPALGDGVEAIEVARRQLSLHVQELFPKSNQSWLAAVGRKHPGRVEHFGSRYMQGVAHCRRSAPDGGRRALLDLRPKDLVFFSHLSAERSFLEWGHLRQSIQTALDLKVCGRVRELGREATHPPPEDRLEERWG